VNLRISFFGSSLFSRRLKRNQSWKLSASVKL
jgi:hypothetical protein